MNGATLKLHAVDSAGDGDDVHDPDERDRHVRGPRRRRLVTAAAGNYRISYVGGDGNDVTLTVVNRRRRSRRSRLRRCRRTRRSSHCVHGGDSEATPPRSRHRDVVEQGVVTDANRVGGSGASRTIAITPNVAARGDTTITLTVSDGADIATTTFVLSVTSGTYYLAEGATGASSTRTSCSRIRTRRRRRSPSRS